MDEKKQFIMDWAVENKENISEWHQTEVYPKK